MNLFCIGLSHHTANVTTREQFAGNATAESIASQAGCTEALLLTTCNRVEVYVVSDKRISTDEIARCLMEKTNCNLHSYAPPFYRYEDHKCVQHLFRVASGLDSMVVGESEIFGQAKKAYESARTSGAVGPYLHRLFQRAFRVAKQVRTHTEIARGAVSVGSVAVELAQRIFGNLSECKVLVLGAGETSERTARALVSRGVIDLRVSNRSLGRAHDLAQAVGGCAVPFDDWARQCREIDILLTSTASETPLLAPDILAPMLRERLDRPLFIIDVAVPRNVDPSVNSLSLRYRFDTLCGRAIPRVATPAGRSGRGNHCRSRHRICRFNLARVSSHVAHSRAGLDRRKSPARFAAVAAVYDPRRSKEETASA